jgi:hypothetical protein
MRETSNVIAASIAILIAAVGLILAPCAGAAETSTPNVSDPTIKKAASPPATIKKPPGLKQPPRISNEALKAAMTGTGKYVLDDVEYTVEGAQPFTAAYAYNANKVSSQHDDSSVIIVNGKVHALGIPGRDSPQMKFAIVGFRYDQTIFADLPATCEMNASPYPQTNIRNLKYKTVLIFKDTATKSACWRYFSSLKSINLEPTAVSEGAHHTYTRHALTDGAPRTLMLGPMQSRDPAGD